MPWIRAANASRLLALPAALHSTCPLAGRHRRRLRPRRAATGAARSRTWSTIGEGRRRGGPVRESRSQPLAGAGRDDCSRTCVGMSDPGRAADRRGYLDGQLTALAAAAAAADGQFGTVRRRGRDGVRTCPPVSRRRHASPLRVRPSRHCGPVLARPSTRYAAYRAALTGRCPGSKPLLRCALAACRRAAAEVIPVADDEAIELVLRSGSPWDGFARYLGNHRTRIEINRRCGARCHPCPAPGVP